MRKVLLYFFLLAIMPIQLFATFSEEERLADFHELVSLVEINYAPLFFKEETVGLDWPKHVQEFRNRVITADSDEKFYGELVQFLVGLQDTHINTDVPSNLQASLGFICEYIEGKVLIAKVNRKLLPESMFPFKRGDELVAIDHESVEDLLNEIQKYVTTGYPKSSRVLATAYLTIRRQRLGLPVPKGKSTIQYRPRNNASLKSLEIPWMRQGRPLLSVRDDIRPSLIAHTPRHRLVASELFALTETFDDSEQLIEGMEAHPINVFALSPEKLRMWHRAGMTDLGENESVFPLPANAKKLPMIPFTAAVYEQDGKRIGLLRIPHYNEESVAQQVATALMYLENNTDVLVLDQMNNPGGQVTVVSEIASYFLREESTDMQFKLRASRKWLEMMSNINQQMQLRLLQSPTDALIMALAKRFDWIENMLVDRIENRDFLTDAISLDLFGDAGKIQPNPMIKYTKPVLMLINELDFSGGDALPALLRDHNRVTLFGTRTTGAGGNVGEFGPLTHSYFKFSLTESLMIRPNGDLVENIGVAPDIEYEITENDFMHSYKDYVNAFTKEALRLITP